MCGISGIISLDRNQKVNWIERVHSMNNALIHRGPDDWGIYTNIDCKPDSRIVSYSHTNLPPFALGHRRLSIIDLSAAGRQPFVSEECDAVIDFNGEIYNYIELRKELSAFYDFKTDTDTEVLLKAYHRWGEHLFDKLEGMYAFVIIDWKKKEAFAARDTVGIKPLYYYYDNQKLVFASEPKAVLKGLDTKGQLDWTRASEFLMLGLTDHDDGSFFQEIKQLEGGHFFKLNLSNGNFIKKEYRKRPQVLKNVDFDAESEYLKVAKNAIGLQLRSDVPLGSSLSGGIDSSTIVTLAGEMLGEKAKDYKTLTFSFPGQVNDEAELAQIVANNANMQWQPITPSLNNLEDDLKKMTLNMGEPFSTLSMFAQYKVMQSAKQLGITVMLDGQGGDEVYLGYPRIAQRVMFHYLSIGKPALFFKEWSGLEKNLSISKLRSLLGNLYFNSGKIVLTRNAAKLTPYIKKDLLYAYRKDLANDFYASKNIYDKQWDELVKYCLPRLLKFADRNSMAFSVEQRVPHLAQSIINFALQLPVEYRVNNGWTKYNVRKAMTGKIPDQILWDNVKRGFSVPQAFWVEQLSKLMTEWISNLPDDSPIIKDKVIKDLTSTTKGDPHFWRVISLANFMSLSQLKN